MFGRLKMFLTGIVILEYFQLNVNRKGVKNYYGGKNQGFM